MSGADGSASQRDIALVTGLVEIPSLSRSEQAAVQWLVARMSERGFRVSIDQAGNAVGEIGDGPRHVVLLGHIDTVPGDITVRIEGDELVGRGAVDAKGPLAAFVAAATQPVAGLRVTVVGAVEEESPTSAGARYRATLPAPDWCVVGEPSGWDGVTIAYKGRLVLELQLERSARHGAAPGATIGEEAIGLWTRVSEANAHRFTAERAFDRVDCRLESLTAEGRDGMLERALMRIGYRLTPGVEWEELEREVRAIAARHDGEATVVVGRIAAESPVSTRRSTPLAQAFSRAIVGAGGRVNFKVKSGTSDMNVLAPSWTCPMVAYGPGDASYDHTPIERLSLDEYVRGITVLKSVLVAAVKV